MIGSSSIFLFFSSTVLKSAQAIEWLNFLTPAVIFLFSLIPYLFSFGLLSFIYIYLPNTKVSWKAAIIAGFITGIIYVVWQYIYVTFQAKAASYGTIYGSFAAIPLFLIWLNYSWLIILFGVELTKSLQKKFLY